MQKALFLNDSKIEFLMNTVPKFSDFGVVTFCEG